MRKVIGSSVLGPHPEGVVEVLPVRGTRTVTSQPRDPSLLPGSATAQSSGVVSRRRWLGAAALLAAGSGVLLAVPLRAADDPPPLEVRIDLDEVDLEAGRLAVTMSRPAAKVTLKVIGQSGAVVAEREKVCDATPAGTPIVVTWPVDSSDPVARIEVFGHDVGGYYKGVAITPWSADVPHRDVEFETGSAAIRTSEESKLRQSLKKIQDLLRRHAAIGDVRLYVVAHTDRVGTVEYNLKLSERRARAIAGWFARHGVRVPILYAGLGESVPKVPTEDEVAEAKNRRVDYSLALSPPRFKRSGVQPSFRSAPKSAKRSR